MKNGNLSINSENIFPVIKKWLYSDHDIFVRELISNGCDAVTKLKKLSLMGEFDEPDEQCERCEDSPQFAHFHAVEPVLYVRILLEPGRERLL